jgi:hypothetical protein
MSKRKHPVRKSLGKAPRGRARPLGLEELEARCLLDGSGFRPINEVGNNVANPNWGAVPTTGPIQLLRISPVAYADGISSPSLPNNPSARVISDAISNQADAAGNDVQTVNQSNLTDFGYVWGQFIDHDMDLTPTGSGQFDNILPDPNDPSKMGEQTFERSSFDPATGKSNPRQQVNVNTAFLDLSQVYGSSQTVADALRTFSGGQLKTSPGNDLPFNNSTYFNVQQLAALNMANDSHLLTSDKLFATGDVRGNENVELTGLQTLFVRNHNRLASELQAEHPTWGDEQLYQEARKLNIATEQMITYNSYLPDLLGPTAIAAYSGYKPTVDASIATEFSTVAFRFGHSLLSNLIQRQDNNGNNIPDKNPNGAPIDLAQDFFDPSVINPSGVFDPISGHTTSGIDALLKGDADGNAQAMDALGVNEIRNLLFANGGLKDNGQDLIARDIQRARDDGIGTYNQLRVALGLPAVTSFAQITSNVTLQQELQKAYGTVDNIDPFAGGISEDLAPGSNVGPTFQAVLVKQFTALRDGDRFFYLNESFNQDELNILNQAPTLTKVIEANTTVTNLQSDAFVFTASISGTVFADLGNDGLPRTPGEFGLPGFTLKLEDTSGDVLATTRTDIFGHYTFTQQSGPSANPEIAPGVSATGDYVIVLVLPSFLRQTNPNPSPIHISRGGIVVGGVDFGVTFNFGGGGGAAASLPGTGSGSGTATPAAGPSGAASVLAASTAGTLAGANAVSVGQPPSGTGAGNVVTVTGGGAATSQVTAVAAAPSSADSSLALLGAADQSAPATDLNAPGVTVL